VWLHDGYTTLSFNGDESFVHPKCLISLVGRVGLEPTTKGL